MRTTIVAATGTGKTVMAALDYAGLREALTRSRLLFVAHREEILLQSCATFRQALRDPSFGELWVGGSRPGRFEHVFASIQSLNATGLTHLDPAHFDVVIVDEFHHAAAHSYRTLLDHVRPVELLGLTATPERSDGLPILDWFGGCIAAELRLWDAISQQRLVPFAYYGIHDSTDLREVPWRRGRGYDAQGLSNLFTANDIWARFVLQELEKRVDDLGRMRALGFCVGIDHARFMDSRQARQELAGVIGTARRQDQQFRWVVWTGAIALSFGLLGSPVFARLLPFGLDGQVAAFILRGDRWNAGEALMRADSPTDWAQLAAAGELSKANKATIEACRAAAAKTKKEQHCTVVVPAP